MRTTLTIDEDVHQELVRRVEESRLPYKVTVNEVMRAGLRELRRREQEGPQPPSWPVFDLGAPLVDLDKAMALADELDDLRTKMASGGSA